MPAPAQPAPAPQPPLSEAQLRELLLREPSRSEAWTALGLLEASRGRHAEAVEALAKASALDPQPALFHHLGASCQALGRRDEAVSHYHKVVQLKPDVAEAHNNWGIALAQSGKRKEAADAFAQALRLKPDFPEAHNNRGIALVEEGKPEEGAEAFKAALSANPNYPEARANLGLALSRLGRAEEALAAFQEAARISPGNAEALLGMAGLHRDAGRLPEAESAYREALKARPAHADARQQLAAILARQGKAEEAIAALHQAVLFHPDDPNAFNGLGAVLAQANRLDEAAAAFRQALKLRPEHAEALANLGSTLLRQQKGEEAVSLFQKALELRPSSPQAHAALGGALGQLGRHAEAVPRYEEAVRLDPSFADAHFGLGNALREAGRPEEAVARYKRVLELRPGDLGARLNEGVALSEIGRLDDAVQAFQAILEKQPKHAAAHNSMGVARLHQARPQDALECFAACIAAEPENADAHLNKALTLLQMGNLAEGWDEYEWRWKLKRAGPCPHPQPAWDGSPVPDKSVLLWSEQGLGDTIQFVRYAALAKGRAGKVYLDCPGPLRGLLAGCPGVDALWGAGAGQHADFQAPLMGLPRLFGTRVEGIPSSGPYLFADAAMREAWRARAQALGPGLKVGIAWQGNTKYAGDRHRSVRLEKLKPLAGLPGVRLVSIQKGPGSEQLGTLGKEMGIEDWGALVTGDFRDTAGAVSALDLVVAVDTSIAHLAGALGVPVWVMLPLNPDWRWLLGREDSPWYPSARLFRQEKWGDWDGVVSRIAKALKARSKRPLLASLSPELPLAEVADLAARQGEGGPAWAALRSSGVLDRPEAVAFLAGLVKAHADTEAAVLESAALNPGSKGAKRAAALFKHLHAARAARAAALAGLGALLAGQPVPAPAKPA